MSVKLLTEHHLKFLSLTGGCTGLSESTLVKQPHFSKSNDVAQMFQTKRLPTTQNKQTPPTTTKQHTQLSNKSKTGIPTFSFVISWQST